jgi:hypothetical protein
MIAYHRAWTLRLFMASYINFSVMVHRVIRSPHKFVIGSILILRRQPPWTSATRVTHLLSTAEKNEWTYGLDTLTVSSDLTSRVLSSAVAVESITAVAMFEVAEILNY